MKEYRKIRMSRAMTVGQWLERTIAELKTPALLKPSSNYQVYVTLLHKLETEGHIIDMPIKDVRDRTYRRLIKWMAGRPNYDGTLRTFTALLNRARKARLTRYVPDFPFRNFAPRNTAKVAASDILSSGGTVRSLTLEQWEAFKKLDLHLIDIKNGPMMEWWKKVYHDFCILLYELKSRPVDVLQLHCGSLALYPEFGRTLCSYVPEKKKNKGDFAIQFISKGAEEIIARYRGMNRYGYVFPFPVNSRRWNLNNARQYEAHYRAAQNQLAKVNRFLHAVGVHMGLPFPLTIYVLRRSAITHAIIENRVPIAILAKMAGTSVRMIERHYTNYLHTLAEY